GDGIVANDGECSLLEAILNANGDTRVFSSSGECAKGAGADTITLATDVTLTYGYNDGPYYLGYTGLPVVTSNITIMGNGHTIQTHFEDEEEYFRVLAVIYNGDLVLNNVIISGGSEAIGGNIYNANKLTLRQSTVTNGF